MRLARLKQNSTAANPSTCFCPPLWGAAKQYARTFISHPREQPFHKPFAFRPYAVDVFKPLLKFFPKEGESFGRVLWSASIIITASPDKFFSPAVTAASLPKLRASETIFTNGCSFAAAFKRAGVSSVIPSLLSAKASSTV